MKICVFGDVHGNLEQFEKLTKTDDFASADMRICLGDMVGLGPYQKECMDLLCKYEHTMVLGNHEARMTKLIDDLNLGIDERLYKQFDMYRKQLKDYLPIFEKLPKSLTIELCKKKLCFCHYGWIDDDMSSKNRMQRTKSLTEQFGLKENDFDFVFYGHIHSPSQKIEGKTKFVGVGSLGLKSPSNYLMIFANDNDLTFERKTLDFDKEKFFKDCERLNFPKWEQLKNFSFDNNLEKNDGNVLITGGAGYIGTNIAKKLVEMGYYVVIVDNFSNSYCEHINNLKKAYPANLKIYDFDLLDTKKLEQVLIDEDIFNVIHLAGKKYVGESFEKKDEYYISNVTLTKNLLDLMAIHNISNFVFSSSITVYGKPLCDVVDETHICKPLSPYAKQKLECEQLVKTWQQTTGASATILRLSNPVGANKEFLLGDDPKTKDYMGVLPYIINKARNNEKLVLNGGDHPTKDGTTIRDYIHVEDVAMAFKNAMEKNDKTFAVYNIGSSVPGHSVLDILKQCEKLLNKKLDYSFGPRREGDVSVFVSNNTKAKNHIDFSITKKLDEMVESQLHFKS